MLVVVTVRNRPAYVATSGESGKVSDKRGGTEIRSMVEKTAKEERRGVNGGMSGKVMEQINLHRHWS